MLAYLDPIYFNIYFGDKDYSESGISELDMVKFAISHVYLYETLAENLKVDLETSEFTYRVKEERVEELVDKYFGVQLSGHHTIEEENIIYNGGYYLMPASDVGWNDEMAIDSITKAGDFAYEIVFTIYNIEGNALQSYKVMLEIRNDRFVITDYVFTETPEDMNVEENEESEGLESSDSTDGEEAESSE